MAWYASFISGSSPLARGTRLRVLQSRIEGRFIPARAGNTAPAPRRPTGGAVHPRSRGEHGSRPADSPGLDGSSPLARGTRVGQEPAQEGERFIPARAGNTGRVRVRVCSRSVHPRSRGEHDLVRHWAYEQTGSSPLARGTRMGLRRGDGLLRFIPARAGNTDKAAMQVRKSPVHPRSRGEHILHEESPVVNPGSSPLARGTQRDGGHAGSGGRFIPARAGNTFSVPPRGSWSTVHPRSRGEHACSRRGTRRCNGSSPLARGTHWDWRIGDDLIRFIPARAGNTNASCWKGRVSTVHPRSRGEHLTPATPTDAAPGSSPLARGTRLRELGDRDSVRFIPARAGNTPWKSLSRPTASVHPRSRGEHVAASVRFSRFSGSSPLARGTHGDHEGSGSWRRFIPARAGNTQISRLSRAG